MDATLKTWADELARKAEMTATQASPEIAAQLRELAERVRAKHAG